MFLVSVAALAAGACTAPVTGTRPYPASPTLVTNDSLRPSSPLAANPSRDIWPARYREARPEVRGAYDYAIGHHETLRWIPCYCGCGADGHRDNFDCYVAKIGTGGWVVLDTHSFG